MGKADLGVVIVAGGQGNRAQGGASQAQVPKQYRMLGGRSVLARTLAAFLDSEDVTHVQPVIGPDHGALYEGLALSDPRLLAPVIGGQRRQASVLKGLEALAAQGVEYVMIHDAARPFVSLALIAAVRAALDRAPGALPAIRVTDTIKRSIDGESIAGTEDRTQLVTAQTPQGFRFEEIVSAHRRAAQVSDSFTDDAAIAEWADLSVLLVPGDPNNIKITMPEDFARAERILAQGQAMETRMGTGFDVHAFGPGDRVILGNIAIAHTAGLTGHSDADVVVHALADALYGALAEGDIGTHFPPSEAQWKGADSAIFLEHAAGRVRARGGRIVSCDVTVLCEAPRIGPHASEMRARLATILEISQSRVSIKATTTERLGFVGRREGIAAQAAATIELPNEAS